MRSAVLHRHEQRGKLCRPGARPCVVSSTSDRGPRPVRSRGDLDLIRKTHREFGNQRLFSSHLMSDVEAMRRIIVVHVDGSRMPAGRAFHPWRPRQCSSKSTAT